MFSFALANLSYFFQVELENAIINASWTLFVSTSKNSLVQDFSRPPRNYSQIVVIAQQCKCNTFQLWPLLFHVGYSWRFYRERTQAKVNLKRTLLHENIKAFKCIVIMNKLYSSLIIFNICKQTLKPLKQTYLVNWLLLNERKEQIMYIFVKGTQ